MIDGSWCSCIRGTAHLIQVHVDNIDKDLNLTRLHEHVFASELQLIARQCHMHKVHLPATEKI